MRTVRSPANRRLSDEGQSSDSRRVYSAPAMRQAHATRGSPAQASPPRAELGVTQLAHGRAARAARSAAARLESSRAETTGALSATGARAVRWVATTTDKPPGH